MKTEVYAALDAERKRQERVTAELRDRMAHLLEEAKTAQAISHRAETGVGLVLVG